MTHEQIRASLIDRVFEALTADYERQNGYLDRKQVDRTLEKRGLSIPEIHAILELLENVGITIHEQGEVSDDLHLLNDGSSKEEITEANRNAFADLIQKTVNYKLLTAREEQELGRAIVIGQRAEKELDQGDLCTQLHNNLIAKADAARSRMALANLRLVAHVARPYFGLSDLPAEDLLQDGFIGLMRAIEKFDHSLGNRFSTYATWWIRQAVTRAIADRGTLIRLPAYLVTEVHRYRRAYRLLHQFNASKTPTLAQLADELAWPLERVTFIQQLSALRPASLDDPILGNPEATLSDLLVSENEQPDECAERKSLRTAVNSALTHLKESEVKVITLRFGLKDDSGGRTLEEVGQLLGLTRERIRQIEKKALQRLVKRAQRNEPSPLSAYCPASIRPEPCKTNIGGVKTATLSQEPAIRIEELQLQNKARLFPEEYRWLR